MPEFKDNYRLQKTNVFRIGLLVIFVFGVFQLLNSFYWVGAVIEGVILIVALSLKHSKIIVTDTSINFKEVAILPFLSENNSYALKDIRELEVDGIASRQFDILDDALPYEAAKWAPSGINSVVITYKDNSRQTISLDINTDILRCAIETASTRLNSN